MGRLWAQFSTYTGPLQCCATNKSFCLIHFQLFDSVCDWPVELLRGRPWVPCVLQSELSIQQCFFRTCGRGRSSGVSPVTYRNIENLFVVWGNDPLTAGKLYLPKTSCCIFHRVMSSFRLFCYMTLIIYLYWLSAKDSFPGLDDIISCLPCDLLFILSSGFFLSQLFLIL